MTAFDISKSLQELENQDWGEPGFDSRLVRDCHHLRRVPLKDLTVENLRIMIGQQVGVDFLVPIAIDRLVQDPLAEGDCYPGDLLVSVLRAGRTFSQRFPGFKSRIIQIIDEAFEVPGITKTEFEALRDAYEVFRRDTGGLL